MKIEDDDLTFISYRREIDNFRFIKTIDEILTAKKGDENYRFVAVDIAI